MAIIPNSHVLRSSLFRGVGAARAASVGDPALLLQAAMDDVRAWAEERGLLLDETAVRAAFLQMAEQSDGSPNLFDEPTPDPEELPEGIEDLVAFAVDRYGSTCMWSANRSWMIEHPKEAAASIARLLRDYGGPDPRPFWLAGKIEAAGREA